MKKPSVWSIVKWSVVICVLVAVVAISRDQIHIAQAEQARLAGEVKDLKSQVSREKSAARIAEAKAQDSKARLLEINEAVTKIEATTEILKSAYNNKVKVLEDQLEAANTRQVTTFRQAPSAPAYTPPTQQVQIPRWNPQPQQVVLKAIKAKALAEHGNNYSSANYEIERQSEAFDKLMRYYRLNTPFMNDLINRTMFERGDDYTGAAYAIDREIEAKQKLDSK